jgi:hypothetical protein
MPPYFVEGTKNRVEKIEQAGLLGEFKIEEKL